ncbi:uro-adherence factor A [Bactrocera oleae]|uniref:uro-adherence factor A n=1 Tax=Bactrocera oleae TaxID=104688 RepID=UPI00387E7A67
MDLDDLDIYEDLDTFQQEEEKKTAELVSLEAKYNDTLKTIETLQSENADLKKQIRRIGINFQNLLDTAKSEIKRKDKQIEQLRKEKDDICFRRKQPRREYTDVASTSQNPNTWFKNETVLPTYDVARNTNENAQITSKNVEAINNEQPSETSYIKRGRENTRIPDEYKKNERRNESFERKYEWDPQREKYNRSNNQKDQHVSRYTMRSTERDGSVRSATRDYSHSHDRRTADRCNNDERDFKNKTLKSENEKGSCNSTKNGRRQHAYDRVGDRSRYHGKEEKNKSESYERRHDRRSDSKETRTKSDNSDDRHDKRNDSKHHREDTNKRSKETNERARADKIRNETATSAKNSDGLTQSKDMRDKAPNTSESRREKKLNEYQKFCEAPHKDTKNIETVKERDFLDEDLRASKDSQSLEKLLAEEKLTKEKLSALENEFSCKETDKNANRLISADGMTTPKKTALFDKLFGSTPTNAGDVNSNTLSNVNEFLKSSNSSATTSPSNYTDTSEPTTITSTIKRTNTESEEYYIPIKVEQNEHNKTEARLVANSYNRDLEDIQTSASFNFGIEPRELISSTKNQAANENSAEKSVTSVNSIKETINYAKLATLMLSEDEEETEFDKAAETNEDETVNNATKSNGNIKNGGIQILQNIRLPNIYEIRAHQRRLRELAAAKRAKLAKIAETNGTKQHATQSITKMVVPMPEQVTKSLQKNPTTTTNAADNNNQGVDLQEERVEAKIQREKKSINNSPQLYGEFTADANVITLDNEMTKKVTGSETTKYADQQSIENVKLLDKNITLPSEAVANTELANNDKMVANDAALKQMKYESEESLRSKNTEKSAEVVNVTEKIDDIANSKPTVKIDEIATTETILNEVFSKALETADIVVEKVEVQNDTKSEQIAIKNTDAISAVSATTNKHNEKDQTSCLRLDLATASQTTAPNKVMSTMNSNLLTKALPNDSERKINSMVESKENISKLQQLYESKDEVSRSSKQSENSAINAPVGEDAAQPIACGENAKNILFKSAMDVEEKVSLNVIAEQDKIVEHKKINATKTCITQEEFVEEPESVHTTNGATIEVKIDLGDLKSNCEPVLSEEKSAGNKRESPDAITEQKTIARSEVAEQKTGTESIVYKNVELLASTDTINECSHIIEIGITKSSELMVTDAIMSIVNDSAEKSECSKNVELTSNGDNSIITTTNISVMTDSGTGPVIEETESAKPNGMSEESKEKPKNSYIEENEEKTEAQNISTLETKGVVNNLKEPKNSYIEENEKITEAQNVPTLEAKGVVNNLKEPKNSYIEENEKKTEAHNIHTLETKGVVNNLKEPKNSYIEENEKKTEAQNVPTLETTGVVNNSKEPKNSYIEENEKKTEAHNIHTLETKGVVNNLKEPKNSYIEENEKKTETQNIPTLEKKGVVKSKEVELQPKTVQEFADDSQRSKNSKTKSKELSNTVNISTERNLLIENMKRAEVLWKFKIPKISAKRKREESADGSRFQESRNVETFESREKLGIKAEEAIIPYKKKKTTKLIPKQMQEETKVLEINGNIVKNLLETKTLFENQKKSERIIKEIDNWARRKVGDTTDILETENPVEYNDKIPTDLKASVKQKTEKHKAHKDNNIESFSVGIKCVTEKQQEHNKPPTVERSMRERSSDKRDQTHLLKGQHSKIQERRKSHTKVEHEENAKDTKIRNVKYDVEMHKQSSQKHEEVVAKCEEKLAAKSEQSELKTRKVESIEKENNTVKKALGTRELDDKTKKYFNTNIPNEITVKKALERQELDDKTKKCKTTQNIRSKSQLDVATVSCEITAVKCDLSKESADNLKQKKECDKNCFVEKKNKKSSEKCEVEADKRAKADVEMKEMAQKLTATEISATDGMQVVTSAHAYSTQCAATIAKVTNTATTNNIQRITTKYGPTPKRRQTSTSSDDAEVVSKAQRRKRCKMRIEDSDEEEEEKEAAHSLPSAVPTVLHVAKPIDLDRKNKDIIDILQNDRANESNENLPAPQTPTSLPMNVSQDAEYEEIDSRLQLMFASPKIADKTSSTHALAGANQANTQLLSPTLKERAVATHVIGFATPETADKTSATHSLVVASSAVVTAVTGTAPQPVIVLPPTAAPIGNPKPLSDFNATSSFLSDISANSFLASDLNITIDETNRSGINTHTSLSDSSLSTKHISLGSSDYRFEKVSEHVVNLFITRKRRGKRKPTAATITTNTVAAT